jgi:hypothetical protein
MGNPDRGSHQEGPLAVGLDISQSLDRYKECLLGGIGCSIGA